QASMADRRSVDGRDSVGDVERRRNERRAACVAALTVARGMDGEAPRANGLRAAATARQRPDEAPVQRADERRLRHGTEHLVDGDVAERRTAAACMVQKAAWVAHEARRYGRARSEIVVALASEDGALGVAAEDLVDLPRLEACGDRAEPERRRRRSDRG